MLPRIGLALAFCALAACGSTAKEKGEEERPPKPPPLASELPPGPVVRTSRDCDFGGMIDELREADVVYVGEDAGNPDHLLLQLLVVEYLAYYGRLHAIAIEAFAQDDQAALDDYVFGRAGEEVLRERCPVPFAQYQPVLRFARGTRIPVVGLAVAPAVRTAVAAGGLDGLSDEQRRSLPAVDPERAPAARAYWRARSEGDEAAFARAWLVRCVEEAAMADALVRWSRTAPDDAQVVVLGSTDRFAWRWGVPDLVRQRFGRVERIVIPLVAGEEGPDPAVFSQAFADYVWLTPHF